MTFYSRSFPLLLAALWMTIPFAILAPPRAAAEDTLSVREERAMKAAVARVAPSVVRIETIGGLERVGQLLVGTGPTTGLAVTSDGYILSSGFNFVQKPDSIVVTVADGSRKPARLVATDHSRMIVLLKIENEAPLEVPEFVPADQVRVGAWALAVGRTFEATQPNASVGIVSAVDRIWNKAVQTDAKISPNNYGGPLVDIAGRVIGLLVPMSPQAGGEVAGVEWYDSGIGFAVPLEPVLRWLPKMREGKDLHAGLLGVSLKGDDIYANPVLIAAVRATGPAAKAGLRAGDKIVEAGGKPITRQAELKHQLGALYGGERIKLVALRGEERIEREVELVDSIEPYDAPFLGIAPLRLAAFDPAPGVVIRYVYPDSPAATAGLRAGDRIVSLAGQPVARLSDMQERLAALAVSDAVKLEARRGEQTLPLEVTLGRVPETLPAELPPAHPAQINLPPLGPEAAVQQPAKGLVPVKFPEFENDCTVYVPATYDARLAYGVIVWLPAPGEPPADDVVKTWQRLCDEHDFVLLMPRPAQKGQWQPAESRFVRRALESITKTYTIDPARIVVHGHQSGGAMAFLVAASNEETVRGVAMVDSPLPRAVGNLETDPLHPLAFYIAQTTGSEASESIEAGSKRLRSAKFPLVVKSIAPPPRYLNDEEMAELVRWCDLLDRQ